jgi:hypothetical protein
VHLALAAPGGRRTQIYLAVLTFENGKPGRPVQIQKPEISRSGGQ